MERISATVSSSGEIGGGVSTTELDSHANMVVVGHQAYVISHTTQFVNDQAFVDEVAGLRDIYVVDAAIGYDCTYSRETYILVFYAVIY